MSASPPWGRLKDAAATKRDDAARRLAAAVRAGAEARRKAATLRDYRGEYEQKLANVSASGIDATTLRNYQAFLAQLDRAIALQAEQIARADSDLVAAKSRWTAEHRRTESFQALDDRHSGVQALAERRREQKQADEWVTQSQQRRAPPAR